MDTRHLRSTGHRRPWIPAFAGMPRERCGAASGGLTLRPESAEAVRPGRDDVDGEEIADLGVAFDHYRLQPVRLADYLAQPAPLAVDQYVGRAADGGAV